MSDNLNDPYVAPVTPVEADPYLPVKRSNTIHNLEYSGDGVEMALLFLKNILLTIVTLSLYRPWARTNLRRYVWGHVSFQGDRASYTGTGEELFKGWAKLVGMFLAIFIAVGIIGAILPFLKILVPFVTPFAYIALFALATYSGLRYRLSRTKWREIKFGVDKTKESTREFFLLYLKGVMLSGFTLGIYFPWFKNSKRTFLTNRMRFGTVHFSYTGQASDYAALCFKSIFFCIITLGFYVPWMLRALTEFRLNNTHFQNSRFLFTLKGGDFLIFALCAYFGTILTLGLASPWIYNWGLRLFISNVKLEGDIDLALVGAAPSEGSSMGEEAVLDYDLDLGF